MTDDKVTITLAAKTTDPNVLRLAAGDVGRMQLGFNGLPKSLPSTLNALADALDQAGDITYEPTRDHWTPYEPWMRDVLADDARVSWVGADGSERRDRAGKINSALARSGVTFDDTYGPDPLDTRIHPDDAPERPTEDDPDEALASSIEYRLETTHSWLEAARAAREHIGHEVQMGNARLLADMRVRAEHAEAERDEARESLDDALTGWNRDGVRYRAERDEWKARYEALRADVERVRRNRTTLTDVLMCIADILDHDDAHDPQHAPDTVTLRRVDAERLVAQWVDRGFHESDDGPDPTYLRVRAALGWGGDSE